MTTTYLYRCFCIEEQVNVDIWGTTTPTYCTNPVAHTSRALDSDKITIVQTISQNTTTVEEASEGWFHSTVIMVDVPAGPTGAVYHQEVSWPADILLWNTTIFANPDPALDGDMIDVIAGPDTTIGYILAPASIGNTTIVVSPTVLSIITRGIDISLTDGVNKDNLGYVRAINTSTNTVTFTNALAHVYNPGALVLFNLHNLRNVYVTHLIGKYDCGQKGIRGKRVPAGTILRLCYTSNSGLATKLACKIECYIMG